ncbi:15678_t:CDS:2, partial [Racocetra persica]
WTPNVVYFITSMFQYESIWIYTASVVCINLGGIANVILYISHESWKNKYDNESSAHITNNSSGSSTYVTNNSSGTSKNHQESYPQIKVHISTVEKANFTSESTLDLSDHEL